LKLFAPDGFIIGLEDGLLKRKPRRVTAGVLPFNPNQSKKIVHPPYSWKGG
jgi:hypothetical protein